MRLTTLEIKNFRSFDHQVINFDNYTCLVGPNGAGKSTILAALNVLFRNQSAPTNVASLEREDFHQNNIDEPIKITATFDQLSEEAKTDLKAYVRQDKLIISAIATWDETINRADVKQYGSRLVMRDFAPFFEAIEKGAKSAELKEIYKNICEKIPELPDAKSKDDITNSLRQYEENHPEKCELIESNDEFYGWSRGVNLLEKHFQWVFIPAVKDPSEEQDESRDTALGKLLQRTIRARVDFTKSIQTLRSEFETKYKDILDKEQNVLIDVEKSLEKRLSEWSHPGVRVKLIWNYDEQRSVSVAAPLAKAKVGEDNFLGDIVRLGHGLQRSFLIAILQELASINEESQPTLLLGIEEPELYQHPPQARHLATLLESLSKKTTQVILTTHSPYFISGKGFETIRVVRKNLTNGKTFVKQYTLVELAKRLSEVLGDNPRTPSETVAAVSQIMQPSQNELYFSTRPILVEGTEDISFISTHLKLSGRWNKFREYGIHFIVCGGKNAMSRPLAIAQGLGIPVFVLVDGDSDKFKDQKEIENNKRDNRCLLRLCGYDDDPTPRETYWKSNLIMWRTRILDEVRNEIGLDVWDAAEKEAREEQGLHGGISNKNPHVISATIETLWKKGKKSKLLERLCDLILTNL